MNPIKQCYLAYCHDFADLDEILDGAREMLPCKEYTTLETEVNEYCEEVFAAGFRCAIRLLRDTL